jgi:hypothetical protein
MRLRAINFSFCQPTKRGQHFSINYLVTCGIEYLLSDKANRLTAEEMPPTGKRAAFFGL